MEGTSLPGKAQVAVGVVLQDDDVVLPAQLIDFLALLQAHGDAEGFWKLGMVYRYFTFFSVFRASSSFWVSMPSSSHGDAHQFWPGRSGKVFNEPMKLGASHRTVSPSLSKVLVRRVHHLLGRRW